MYRIFAIERAKKLAEILPERIGRPLAWVPFSMRLGPAYLRTHRQVEWLASQTQERQEEFLLRKLRHLVARATASVPFYRELYRRAGISAGDIRSLSDWARVPVVTKADLQAVPLRDRCASGARGMRLNSGGTSGEPLGFLVDRKAFAREWAHMHHIWMARGYRNSDVKITFRGKHFTRDEPIRYNAVHNEYLVNASCSMEQVLSAAKRCFGGSRTVWLWGYPSLIAEFAHLVSTRHEVEQLRIRNAIKGVLLGSEFPAEVYRTPIENHLSTNTVTWYGHSEMALLAYETARGIYQSFPTYGFTEAEAAAQQGGASRLLSSSLHNLVHPFIRYDTGDVVYPVCQIQGTLAFRISEGRIGDFVLDRAGRRHSLTAVIFGRHHPAFDKIRHVQVQDIGKGQIRLLVVPRHRNVHPELLLKEFDLRDLDMEFTLDILAEPVRTSAGKVRLLVR